MKHEILKGEGLERTLKITLDASELRPRYDAYLKQAAQNAQFPGFRKGKITTKALEQRFGEGILQDLAKELMQSELFKIMQEESINPAGYPALKLNSINIETGLDFEAQYNAFPEFELPKLSELEIERFVSSVEDDDVQKAIDGVLAQHTEYEASTAPAQMNDRTTIDFKGFLGDEAFEGGTAEGHTLVLGSGQFIPGFEDGIVGMNVGETKRIDLTFPEDYGHEKLKGQDVVFEVVLQKLESPKTLELTEEFLKKLGVKEGTEEALRTLVRTQMERDMNQALEGKNREAMYDALKKHTDFELPPRLLAQESERLAAQMSEYLKNQNQGGGQPTEFPKEMFASEAENRVRVGLLMDKFITAYEINPTNEDVDAFIHERGKEYDKPEAFFNHYKTDENRYEGMKNRLIDKKTVEYAFKEMKNTEKRIGLEELLRSRSNQG